MSQIEQLLKGTPHLADPAPAIRNAAVIIGAAVDDHPDISHNEMRRRYVLEPFFSMIEYTDGQGVVTRRRVTMRNVEEHGDTRYLYAFCHERRALRMFRLDRIACLISQDGEIEDAAMWFTDVLAEAEVEEFEAAARKAKAEKTAPISPYTALRRNVTPALTILLASARSDDILHPREIDVILRYVEDEAFGLRDAGIVQGPFDGAIFDKIDRTIRRLRPTQEDLAAAFAEMSAWDMPRKRRLAHALALCARADGRIDDIESAILEEMRAFGSQQHGFGWMG